MQRSRRHMEAVSDKHHRSRSKKAGHIQQPLPCFPRPTPPSLSYFASPRILPLHSIKARLGSTWGHSLNFFVVLQRFSQKRYSAPFYMCGNATMPKSCLSKYYTHFAYCLVYLTLLYSLSEPILRSKSVKSEYKFERYASGRQS